MGKKKDTRVWTYPVARLLQEEIGISSGEFRTCCRHLHAPQAHNDISHARGEVRVGVVESEAGPAGRGVEEGSGETVVDGELEQAGTEEKTQRMLASYRRLSVKVCLQHPLRRQRSFHLL